MAREHRTATGKMLDMEKLRLQNEETIAVGDFGGQLVNARGDIIGSNGEIIKSRNEVMAEHYKVNTQIPQDNSSKLREAKLPTKNPAPALEEDKFEEITFEEEVETTLADKIEKGE